MMQYTLVLYNINEMLFTHYLGYINNVYMDTIHSCTLNAGLFLNALNVRTCISIARMHMNTQTCMCTRT